MSEVTATINYLLAVELLGLSAWPITKIILHKLPDRGWGFSKIVGIILVSWISWILSSLHILPFGLTSLILAVVSVALINWGIITRFVPETTNRNVFAYIILEEIIFVSSFIFWTYLRGFSPDTNGLEKFMDFGFMLSAAKTKYFPPLDHFLAGETINYYYYGHYIAAAITTLARVPANFGYNLQMSLLFAFTLIESFSLGSFLFRSLHSSPNRTPWREWLSGTLSACFVGLFGNLHTIIYLPIEKLEYWYPDATRFIANTIHEFPIYSFVVNDLHGHVSDIPIVLLIIGVLLTYLMLPIRKVKTKRFWQAYTAELLLFIPLSFIIGTTYVTNAWDFAIYLILSGVLIWLRNTLRWQKNDGILLTSFQLPVLLSTGVLSFLLLSIAILWYLPFWQTVAPISHGIGIVPIGGNSPLWQIAILWGVQLPLIAAFFIWLRSFHGQTHPFIERVIRSLAEIAQLKVTFHHNHPRSDTQTLTHLFRGKNYRAGIWFFSILTALSLLLIILPEIIFIRDIYPTHYRANTMFKFYYQAWLMLGLLAGAVTVTLWSYYNRHRSLVGLTIRAMTILLIFSGSLYTVKSIEQGFGGFNSPRQTINGTAYLDQRYPADAKAIAWINENIDGQPTLLEAVGDSYTDYARIASNTGLPTVLGWPVHEWLWRGSYGDPIQPITHIQNETQTPDTVGNRTEDVKLIYESADTNQTTQLMNKYHISYIYVSQLEREKYPQLNEDKFAEMDFVLVYDKEDAHIYKTNE